MLSCSCIQALEGDPFKVVTRWSSFNRSKPFLVAIEFCSFLLLTPAPPLPLLLTPPLQHRPQKSL